MLTSFDVQAWLNSNWSELNNTHWLGNESWAQEANTTDGPPAGISPPPDLILRILETFLEFRISQYLGIYGYPALIVIGSLGNALSFVVMTRKTMVTVSTCFYMAVLAVADTIVLYFSCLRRWITYLQNYDTSNVSPAGCKTLTFITYWCFQFSSWILVVMTIDRFLAIHYPLKALSFRVLRHPKWIVLVIALVCSAFDLQYFFITDLNDEGDCLPLEEHRYFHEKIWPWLDATIYSFLPFVLLFVFNIIIIVDNKKAQKRQAVLQAGPDNGSSTQARQDTSSKITIMLLTVSFSFLICSAPKVILLIVREDAFEFYGENGSINWQDLATYRLVSAITNIFLYINHSINFFLYCVSGRKFRQELRSIFRHPTKSFQLRGKRRSVASTCTSMSELNSRSSFQRSSSEGSVTSEVSDRQDPTTCIP